MMTTWLYALGSVTVVSLISLIGIFTMALNPTHLRKIVLYMVSFAVGSLFGDALIHLIPESFENSGNGLHTSLLVIAGILLFFSLEKFLRWRHCHIPTSENHIHPVATLNWVGDAVHNLLDGVIIGASFLVNVEIGLATTLAVILHEIPQEIGDFGILVHNGLSVGKALFLNFLSALLAVAGVVISLTLGSQMAGYTALLVPITAGGFLYVAGSDLIPELHDIDHEKIGVSFGQLSMIILGVAVMAALTSLE
jgi:zinc and cadmium transporter